MSVCTRLPQTSVEFLNQARQCYEFSLNNLLFDQAVFYAEIMVTETSILSFREEPTNIVNFPDSEAVYNLSLAYFLQSNYSKVYSCLKSCELPRARYLFALACFHLLKYDEAEAALQLSMPREPLTSNLENFKLSRDNIQKLFAQLSVQEKAYINGVVAVNGACGLFLLARCKESLGKRNEACLLCLKCLEVCPIMFSAFEKLSWLILGENEEEYSANMQAVELQMNDKGSLANILFNPKRFESIDLGPSESTNRTYPLHTTFDSTKRKSVLGKMADRIYREQVQIQKKVQIEETQIITLPKLLHSIASCLHSMHDFNRVENTLSHLDGLPSRYHQMGYIADIAGRSYFESADYLSAIKVYETALKKDPKKNTGLEYYSTALWQLRKEVELSYLANQVLQQSKLKPEVWCVIGNCFSLQKEHDHAIKFFRRAIQVDPSFCYAYTLCAHEYVTNEKFDKAIKMFEHAMTIDSRHYNAWWGLGNIFYRQEEYQNANYHFHRALQINKNNAVLRCYMGMVFQSLGEYQSALRLFDQAVLLEERNGMALFRKASLLMEMENYEAALQALLQVRSLAPKEPFVHFYIGKVCMKLEKAKKALTHFNIALDLNRDSKDHHTIKSHIEKLKVSQLSDGTSHEENTRGDELVSTSFSNTSLPTQRSSPGTRYSGDPGGQSRTRQDLRYVRRTSNLSTRRPSTQYQRPPRR